MKQKGNGLRVSSFLLLCLAVVAEVVHPLWVEGAEDLAEGTRALYQGNYQQAQMLAHACLQAHPGNPQGWILLARSEIALGKDLDAFQALRKALRLDRENVDALYYLGRVSTLLSQMQFQELYALAPESARAHQLAAESFLLQKRAAEAEEEYKAALKSNPELVEVLDALGDMTRSQFRFDEAERYYSRAAELAPHDYASAYGLGACALFRQQPQRAIEYFQRALRVDPGSAAARLALADALLRENEPSSAVAELKKATALEPSMRQAYFLLARAYSRLGQPEAAKAALQKERELARTEKKELPGLEDLRDQPASSPP